MSEPEFGPTQFKAEVEKLQREGRMPSIERLLEVIGETRAEYRERILEARKSRKAGPELAINTLLIATLGLRLLKILIDKPIRTW
jgi:hypothetical protein